MDLKLAGSNVLVTGAGQGLGRTIADAFVAEGANVAYGYHSSAQGAEQAVAAAAERGVRALAIGADVSEPDEVDRLVGEAVDGLGSIDVLVNNAAYTDTGPFVELAPDDLRRMIDVTVYGTALVTQAVVRHMASDFKGRGQGDGSDFKGRGQRTAASDGGGSGGAIVSLMGDSGRVGESRLAGVAATRASTTALMKSVAKEFGRKGIRANTVSLGLVRSERFDHHTGSADAERLERIAKMYPLGRVGVPSDVPPMVLLLASPLSGWITGQTVSVNGGYSMV